MIFLFWLLVFIDFGAPVIIGVLLLKFFPRRHYLNSGAKNREGPQTW